MAFWNNNQQQQQPKDTIQEALGRFRTEVWTELANNSSEQKEALGKFKAEILADIERNNLALQGFLKRKWVD